MSVLARPGPVSPPLLARAARLLLALLMLALAALPSSLLGPLNVKLLLFGLTALLLGLYGWRRLRGPGLPLPRSLARDALLALAFAGLLAVWWRLGALNGYPQAREQYLSLLSTLAVPLLAGLAVRLELLARTDVLRLIVLGAFNPQVVRDAARPYSYELQWLALLMQLGVLGTGTLALPLAVLWRSLLRRLQGRRAEAGARLLWLLLFTLWLASGLTNPYLTSSVAGLIFTVFMFVSLVGVGGKPAGERLA